MALIRQLHSRFGFERDHKEANKMAEAVSEWASVIIAALALLFSLFATYQSVRQKHHEEQRSMRSQLIDLLSKLSALDAENQGRMLKHYRKVRLRTIICGQVATHSRSIS